MRQSLSLLLLLAGCASTPITTPSKDIFYRNDIYIASGGQARNGIFVVPRNFPSPYHFDLTLMGDADLFTFQTCHREIVKENAGQGGIFGNKRKVAVDYAPVAGIENTGSCVIRLAGYNQQGTHSWGVIDFEGPDATLPATVKCDGNQYQSQGVTICQAKQGLIQQIIFPVEVLTSPDPKCPMPAAKDGKTFTWPMVARECVYAFMERAEPHRVHRLTTLGYEQVLIRGN